MGPRGPTRGKDRGFLDRGAAKDESVNEARHREAEQALWSSLGLAPTEKQVNLRRTGVPVRVQEVGDGPPIVMVHGGSISGTSWATLVALLPDFRCLMLDRPGCGLSPPLANGFADVRRLEAFADDLLVDVVDAFDLDAAHVVATSFGGYMALRGVAAHPERFLRMVEFGYSIGAPIERVPFVMRLAAVPGLGALAAAMPPTPATVRMILRQIGLRQALDGGKMSQASLDWFRSLLRDSRTMRNEFDTMPKVIRPMKGVNGELLFPERLLANFRTPIHFLWGEEDPFGGAGTARPFVARIPGATLEMMAGAGHAVWMDDAERAAATTRHFLSAT